MRKSILFLTSLFALTACVGGDSDCPWCTWQMSGNSGRSVAKPTALDATPDDMRQNNSNVIKSANIISSVNRILDVYEQSGLDYSNVSTDELPALAEDSRVPVFNPERKILNGLTDAQIRKLREAIYVFRNVIDWDQPHDDAELAVMIKLMNAVYNIESGGKIKNKFDPSLTMADILAMSPQEQDKLMDDLYVGEKLLYDYVPNLHDVVLGDKANVNVRVANIMLTSDLWCGDLWYDVDGRLGAVQSFERQGNTNVFRYTDGDEHTDVTLNSASNGKLTYADFGYMTVTVHTGGTEEIAKQLWMLEPTFPELRPAVYAWNNNVDMNFKGRAIGLYSKEYADYAGGLKDPITMQTDNATLSFKNRVAEGGSTTFSTTLFMPFSESGWYDVSVNEGGNLNYMEFTNYKGADDTNRLSIDDKSSDIVVTANYGSVPQYYTGDNALDLPAEAVGMVNYDYDDGDGHEDHFRAAYGLVRQE